MNNSINCISHCPICIHHILANLDGVCGPKVYMQGRFCPSRGLGLSLGLGLGLSPLLLFQHSTFNNSIYSFFIFFSFFLSLFFFFSSLFFLFSSPPLSLSLLFFLSLSFFFFFLLFFLFSFSYHLPPGSIPQVRGLLRLGAKAHLAHRVNRPCIHERVNNETVIKGVREKQREWRIVKDTESFSV